MTLYIRVVEMPQILVKKEKNKSLIYRIKTSIWIPQHVRNFLLHGYLRCRQYSMTLLKQLWFSPYGIFTTPPIHLDSLKLVMILCLCGIGSVTNTFGRINNEFRKLQWLYKISLRSGYRGISGIANTQNVISYKFQSKEIEVWYSKENIWVFFKWKWYNFLIF